MSFSKDKYIRIEKIIPEDTAKLITQYALFDMLNDFNPATGGILGVPGTHHRYSDNLTESLLIYLQPVIEKYTDKKLIPTYSFFRVYKPGDILPDHTDRPSCEISVSVTLGFKYNNVNDDYRWSLHTYVGDEKRYLKCDTGDAIIYKGCEITHGRDKFEAGEYSYHVQVFLHYVDANGPFSKEYMYDKRPAIGFKNKT